MGNEICGCQTEVSKKYNIDLDQFRKRYHEHYMNFLIKVLIIQIIYVNCRISVIVEKVRKTKVRLQNARNKKQLLFCHIKENENKVHIRTNKIS
ncbi:hypothetical protein C923_00837 [Plasmodium falciparum UGT5.1]|uniref:Uncharacterized protein n=6 Tax=Plasmodium falciparum TaxID=5833 RepID=W7JHK2_PLAFA|nr:hypothetical protein PFFVO_00747 [Plasmodium falciparum Vietnam Oak-Knoll (FVO)]ETW44764.1 hypothetical protein PFNF135_00820 [Plasmodium falciparum NF135/5.C10]EUR78629.1 hypothetical protein PFBG_00725 [Plasmodium falciparum 7G8]EWC78462.1 hypothetical protein C923_00837 [Plasmodium falciparum UGT5.1]